ncbi:mobilization relaxase [Vibrio splendidus]|uniref:Mobilization relaxase n=1 Tax=Vibrio splendidus TaxID=29497 RepID=A0A2N7JKM6_VIBSP|nr:relaxase/mobilization nuclease domain-containing protein [Vibrio splendidus]PMM41469.1 mobilization relaxase [Vibrio splendidus]
MIVKFHARGAGRGSGPVDYLLGKDRARDGATLDRGDPDAIQDLIDSSPYAKKYTSGVLSFEESDLDRTTKDKIMSSFEKALLPGLDADQYSCLWVEHRDKGRLELNFVVPNVELLSGKRLQPYFEKADKPRINAWKIETNAILKLHDPDDPINKRELTTPRNLPKPKHEAARAITDGLLSMAGNGELSNRQDLVIALEGVGFSVVRQTKKSISISDPEGGRNIRLKGLIYEQDFKFGAGLREEIETASARYRATSQERIREAREVYRTGVEIKRAENQRRHSRPEPTHERISFEKLALDSAERSACFGRLFEHDLVARNDHRPESTRNQPSAIDSERARSQGRKNSDEYVWRPKSTLHQDRSGSEQLRSGRGLPVEDTRGILENDRVRNPIIERIRAIADAARNTTKGIREAIQRFSGAIQQESAGQHPLAEKCLELDRASANLSAAAPAVGKALQQEQSIGLERELGDRGMSL